MQNPRLTPVPDDNPQTGADGSTSYVFVSERPGPPGLLPSGRTPRPAETIAGAVRAGDLAKVASLVADPSYSPPGYLEIALIEAIEKNRLDIGRYLLDHGAKMDQIPSPTSRTIPSNYVAMQKSLPFLKLFVEYGWDVNTKVYGSTALFFFIQDLESVTWILDQGADPNLGCSETGILHDGGTLLDLAAMWSTVEIFDKLLARGARLKCSLPLHHAVATDSRDTRVMTRLLELGVDINEPDNKGKPKNGSIGAPIFWALRFGKLDNIKFLVENGADLTVKSPWVGRTPLEESRERRWGNEKITGYLESLSPRSQSSAATPSSSSSSVE